MSTDNPYLDDPNLLAALDAAAPPAQRAKVPQDEAAARGALQGVTGMFGDEVAASIDAALPDAVVKHAPQILGGDTTRAARNWAGAGEKTYAERREAALDYYRQRNANAREDNPWTYGAAELGGGAFMPGMKVLGAAKTVGGRLAAGGAMGYAAGVGGSERPGMQSLSDPRALVSSGIGGGLGVAGGALGDYLAGKLAEKASHQTLVNAGITRGQIRQVAAKEGNPEDFEHTLEEMVAAVRKHGKTWEDIHAAKTAAGEAIGGFHAQAREGAPGLNFSDVQGAEDAVLPRLTTAHDAGTRSALQSESDVLFNRIADGKMNPTQAHDHLGRLRENIYGKGGNGVPQGIDATSQEAYRQNLVDALRANAVEANGGGAISPERYSEAVGEFGPLSQLNRLAMRNQGAIHGAQNNIPFLNHHGGTASLVAGAGALHTVQPALDAAGLGFVGHAGVPLALGAAAVGAIGKSPAALQGLSKASGVVGDALPMTIPGLADLLASKKRAAKDLASGRTNKNYTPPAPAGPHEE